MRKKKLTKNEKKRDMYVYKAEARTENWSKAV